MLLSKDMLEGEDETVPLARPSSSYGRSGYGSRPGSSYSGRPMTGDTLPSSLSTTMDSSLPGGAMDELSTPTSAANIRAKMLQQRQRTLAKQRLNTTGPAASRVLANEGLSVSDVATPMAMGARNPGTPTNGTKMHNNMGMSGAPSTVMTPTSAAAVEKMMLDEKEGNSMVIPDSTPPVSKEEEARRRSTVTQDLMDRGICPVFDPMPAADSSGAKVQVDLTSMSNGEMRAFLHDPAPRNAGMIQCRIVRDRSGLNKLYPKYRMETDGGVFMMYAQKQKQNKTSNYAISMSQATVSKDGDGFIGKLRSDFMGLEFVAYGPGLNPSKTSSKVSQAEALQTVRQELVAVQYSSSLWGSKPRGPRKMSVVIPRVQPNSERLVCRTLHPESEGLLALHKSGSTQTIDPYINKAPKWNDQIGAYVLNFNKRVTQASVKNFQLTSAEDPDTVYLQFGRVDNEIFNIDFRYPMSPFQAFAICLSSFDYKLCCE